MALLGGLESDLGELQEALDMISGKRPPEQESEPEPGADSQMEIGGKVVELRVPGLSEVLTLLERIATALESSRPHLRPE